MFDRSSIFAIGSLSVVVCFATIVSAIGCSDGVNTQNTTGTSVGGHGGEGGVLGSSVGGGGAGMGGDGGLFFPTDGGMPEPEMPAEVYAHSAVALYKIDPTTKTLKVVDYFQGCGDVTDIAIDKDSNLIATGFNEMYWIDKSTAKCTFIASGSFPNSLSFVPAGILDPNMEVLVGYQNATYVRIDPKTGVMTNIGALDPGYFSSGDIVSVKGGATYLTVIGPNCNDCLVEVDPKTGSMLKNWGPLGFSSVFGLGFWGGSVYGFNESGFMFEVTFPQGVMNVSPNIQFAGAPLDLYYWGAGSTTVAPVLPPPK